MIAQNVSKIVNDLCLYLDSPRLLPVLKITAHVREYREPRVLNIGNLFDIVLGPVLRGYARSWRAFGNWNPAKMSAINIRRQIPCPVISNNLNNTTFTTSTSQASQFSTARLRVFVLYCFTTNDLC